MKEVVLIENEALSNICENVLDRINNINFKIIKSLNKLKKEYDLYICYIDLDGKRWKEINLEMIINKNVIIFIEKYTDKFLWKITNLFNPIDVILITMPEDIIFERLNNNINKIIKEGI